MNIEFLDKYTLNPESGNYIFLVKVDGKTIQCEVSDHAIQDYAALHDNTTPNAITNIEELLKRYRPILEDIAIRKILAPEFNWKKVSITTADIQ